MEHYNPWEEYAKHRHPKCKLAGKYRDPLLMMAGTLATVLLLWAAAMV